MGKIRWLEHSAFEIHRPDVALIPIGGYYTMGDREAAEAVKLVKPAVVVPMHY